MVMFMPDSPALRKAAERSVSLAEEAEALGTFGVGAVLLGPDLQVITEAKNGVVQGGRVADPTAHAEMRLIAWYNERRRAGFPLPHPSNCVIVTSLDPCMQCAGAIMDSGFSCIGIAPDEAAGVHQPDMASLQTLPQVLAEKWERSLLSFAKPEQVELRKNFGPTLDPMIFERAEAAFTKNMASIRLHINGIRCSSGGNLPPERAADLARVVSIITELENDFSSSEDAAAVINPWSGEVFSLSGRAMGDCDEVALLRLSREYTKQACENRLMLHPSQCVLWTLSQPCIDARGVMAIGIYGSLVEGPVRFAECHWVFSRHQGEEGDLNLMISRFPSLYSDVINIKPVSKQSLHEKLT